MTVTGTLSSSPPGSFSFNCPFLQTPPQRAPPVQGNDLWSLTFTEPVLESYLTCDENSWGPVASLAFPVAGSLLEAKAGPVGILSPMSMESPLFCFQKPRVIPGHVHSSVQGRPGATFWNGLCLWSQQVPEHSCGDS